VLNKEMNGGSDGRGSKLVKYEKDVRGLTRRKSERMGPLAGVNMKKRVESRY